MLSESVFDEMREPLRSLQPAFDAICIKYGFSRTSTGRYPRIRVDKEVDGIDLWIDLSMCLDDDGRYFERFDVTTPFDLAAGAFLDAIDSENRLTRYRDSFLLWKQIPFSSITVTALQNELESVIPRLHVNTRDILLATGESREIRRGV